MSDCRGSSLGFMSLSRIRHIEALLPRDRVSPSFGTQSNDMDEAKRVLKSVFKFDAFRLEQERVVERLVVQSKNALVLFPTGCQSSITLYLPRS